MNPENNPTTVVAWGSWGRGHRLVTRVLSGTHGDKLIQWYPDSGGIWALSDTGGKAEKSRRASFVAAFAPIASVAGRPNVLLIGDSISMAYTLPVRHYLYGRANVHRIPTNGGSTGKGLESIPAWVAGRQWDVIHFNFGLHDLKYLDESGNLSSEPGAQQVTPLDQYRRNLQEIVSRLRQTGAKLVWSQTTPVPEGTVGRFPEDGVRYNQAALGVMEALGVQVLNLYDIAMSDEGVIQKSEDVHFTLEGSNRIGWHVSGAILEALSGL